MLQLPPPNCKHDGTLPPREPGDAPCVPCHAKKHRHGWCRICAAPPEGTGKAAGGRLCAPCRREYLREAKIASRSKQETSASV